MILVDGDDSTSPVGQLAAIRSRTASPAAPVFALAIESFGGQLTHVVRTRMYVTNIDQWQEIGRAHGEFFGRVRPATTMVQVSRLISPEMLVEIEADAILS